MAGHLSFDQMFSAPNLTGLFMQTRSGLPIRVDNRFLQPTNDLAGPTAQWFRRDGTRTVALAVPYGSPAHRRNHKATDVMVAKMVHSLESQVYDPAILVHLLDPETNAVDEQGEKYVTWQTQQFKVNQVNLVQTACQMMLLNGYIYFDSQGRLLPNSSGADITIDPGIPAGQRGQLDILGSGAIIDASWATSGTDIIGQLFEIKRQMLKLGNWEMTTIYYGKNIAKYIANNAEASEYIKRTPTLAQQRYDGSQVVPDGFQGFKWVSAGDLYFDDETGTPQQFFGDDQITITPDYETTWWQHFSGSFPVPQSVGISGDDATTALRNIKQQQGMFSYAKVNNEGGVTNLEHYFGNTFLPMIVSTKAWCTADVVP